MDFEHGYYCDCNLCQVTLEEKKKRNHLSKKMIKSGLRDVCAVCKDSKKVLTVDHIFPKFRGGEDKLSNLQFLCYDCHHKKNTKEARWRAENNWMPEDKRKNWGETIRVTQYSPPAILKCLDCGHGAAINFYGAYLHTTPIYSGNGKAECGVQSKEDYSKYCGCKLVVVKAGGNKWRE